MAETDISWARYTFNLWWGCQEILDPDDESGFDPACAECYARDRSENPWWWGGKSMFPVWGQDVGRRFFDESHYLEPLKWNRAAEKAGKPEFVFCMSMGDWAEGRPDQRPYLEQYLYPMIEQTPWLIYLLLTKRPQIAATIVPQRWCREGWPKNAWPGVTAVTQKWWDIRVPALMKIPSVQQFVSTEPLMGPIDMSGGPIPGWVITGGQSGKKSKPSRPDWFRSQRDQAVAAGSAFHFKQWGEWHPIVFNTSDGDIGVLPAGQLDPESKPRRTHSFDGNGPDMERIGTKQARALGNLLDGREWNEFPEVTNA